MQYESVIKIQYVSEDVMIATICIESKSVIIAVNINH